MIAITPLAMVQVAEAATTFGLPGSSSGGYGSGFSASSVFFNETNFSATALPASKPVAADDVKAWVELILRLADDEDYYADAVSRARSAGAAYQAAVMSPRYVDFFNRVVGEA